MGNIYQVLVKVRVSTDNILNSKLVLVRMFKVCCNYISSDKGRDQNFFLN